MEIKDFKETYGVGWLREYKEAKRIIKRYDKGLNEGVLYKVYYLPEENYCGVSMNLKKRLQQHRYVSKRNTEDVVVLFHSYNKKEAYAMEHGIQRVCGFKGYSTGRIENFNM